MVLGIKMLLSVLNNLLSCSSLSKSSSFFIGMKQCVLMFVSSLWLMIQIDCYVIFHPINLGSQQKKHKADAIC